MNNLKQLIRKNKNVILAIIAILLIIFTAYQLKLVGIAVADSAEIVEIEELAKAEEESKAGEQIVETIENVEEAIQIENITEDSNDANTEELPIETNIDNENTVYTSNEVTNSEISEELKESTTTNTVENTFENVITDVENVTNTENIVTNTIEEENTVNDEIIDVVPTELVFDNGEYKVTVSAIKEDALKNIEKVNVTPITAETNPAEYNKISLKLQDKLDEDNLSKSEEEQTELVGFLAYDITLVDKDGIEAEPDGNVNVSFEYITVPEKVAECADAEVSVVHFEEDKLSGNVALKEFSQEEQKLNVETNDENQVKKLEFETDSFSSFTIKWTATSSRTANITIHYVDQNGNDIQGTQTSTRTVSTGTYTFSDYAGDISNYTYKEARLNSITGDIVTTVTFSSSNNKYTVRFSNGTSKTISKNNTVNYDVYLIYQLGNVGIASSSVPVGSTVSISINDISNIKISDLVGFTWKSSNTSVATVSVDGATGIPTAKGIAQGTTTIIGTRTTNGVTETISWNVTVETKVTSQIIFEHQEQDNTSFADQDNYRPYSEYGYGEKEATNIIKFIVVLADENGKLNMYGSNPDVTLPEGSVVPSSYVFDLDSDKTLTIKEDTFGGISVPGYSYSGLYAYFGWTSNSDTSQMAIVNTFRNFGRVSTGHPEYYSVIGFTTSMGTGADYSSNTFGSTGTGYYAYNPTGVLMLVLSPVSQSVSYKTYYHNDYNPGGTANTNIVDTTSANMVKGEWIRDEYQYDYYGETIMTSIDSSTLVGPVGYKFVGWYDSVDEEGNGTGNLVTTSENQKINSSYYALINGEKIIIVQNNNIYARWEPIIGSINIQKTISGGLNSSEIETVKNQIQFIVKNDREETVATILSENITWNDNVGTCTVSNLPINTQYTVEETNESITGHTVETTTIYPNGLNYAQLSNENESITVEIENEYSTSVIIHKVNPIGELKSGASFEISEAGSTTVREISDLDDGSDNGEINIPYIKYDTEYIISESVAPSGYYTLDTPIHIKVTKVDGKDKITILNSSELSGYVSVSDEALKVVNVQHILMPKAGGCGTYIFYIIGAFIMGSTVLIYKKKLIRKD